MRIRSLAIAAALATLAIAGATTGAAHATTPPTMPAPHLTALDAGRKPTSIFTAAATGLHAANAYVQRNWQTTPWCGVKICQPGQTPNPYTSSTAHVIVDAVPNGGTARFFANQFGAFTNGDPNGGYIGLQTDVITNGVDQGRGFIVSVWGALGATPGAGGTAVSGTEMNDTFWSLHLPYQWVVGHTYALWLSTNLNGTITAGVDDNSPPYASVTLGTFSVPTSWQGFGLVQAEWTEDYLAPNYAICSAIPVSRMRALGSSYLVPTYPHAGVYDTSPEIPYIQNGTGCANSASTLWGNQAYFLLVGATS